MVLKYQTTTLLINIYLPNYGKAITENDKVQT